MLGSGGMIMISVVILWLEWNWFQWMFCFPWILKAGHKTLQASEDLSLCCPLHSSPLSALLSFNSLVKDRCFFFFGDHCYSWEHFLSQISACPFPPCAFCTLLFVLVGHYYYTSVEYCYQLLGDWLWCVPTAWHNWFVAFFYSASFKPDELVLMLISN